MPFDAEAHWGELQGDRYERAQAADQPVIWNDDAGSGKTTNAARAAAGRDQPHAVLFDKHEKAREFLRNDATPDESSYFHLKGAAQKRADHCMDADHADEECPEHGAAESCPSMCPIYDLPDGTAARERYEAVASELGPVWAHILLDPHDGDDCAYTVQYGDLGDRVVGVHEYLTLSTVTGGRQVIVDEKPRSLREERDVTVADLTRAANYLDGHDPRQDGTASTLANIGGFAQRIVNVATDAADAPETLAGLEPPEVVWDTYEAYDEAAGNYLERVAPDEPWQVAERLADAKIRYNEQLLAQIREGEWNGTPLCFDALLAAGIEAGLDSDAAAKAIAAPTTLQRCPRCRSENGHQNGARVCPECGWDEREDTITQRGGEWARAVADIGEDDIGLSYEALPLASELPAAPLILDATATPERVEALFDAEPLVEGDELREANLHVTQVLDGQYHYNTIAQAVDEDRVLADRIQRAIDTAGDVHERPLFVLRADLIPDFEFPDNGAVTYYGGLRGLNFTECDAVMCIGAPHADVDDLRVEAELLAQHQPDLRAGGTEYSTRRDATGDLAAEPPVYRQLLFEDDAGQGRAVPTKAYSGLTGALFRESRENELEQAIHRIRPLLADTTKHVYLLTNVPTAVPVDEVAAFDELADPLEAMLPVPERGLDLLEAVHDVATGAGPDGFRASELVEQRDDGTVANKVDGYHRLATLAGLDITRRTVYNWIEELEAVGLLTPEAYEQHAGVSYTADPSTLKSALEVLSSNAGFEVAAARRFRQLAAEAGGSLGWLRWARDALGLSGDRCGLDPPPGGWS